MSRAKKNRNISENRAISQKIDDLRMKGLRKDRATAAAFRMFSEGELNIKKARDAARKSKKKVAAEKAKIAAADAVRKKQELQKRRLARAEILARRARIEAKRTGEPESVQDQQKRLRTEPIARTIESLRRRQI